MAVENTKASGYESAPLEQSTRPTYWLTRFLILRLLGLVYAIAFLVAINQILPLIGSDGLTPAGIYLKRVSAALGSEAAGFMRLPSLFWFWHSDTALVTWAWIGLVLSCSSGGRLCQCAAACCSLDPLYVFCSCGTGVVWIRLGDPAYRNRFSCYLSLSAARWTSLSPAGASHAHHCFIPMAHLPPHARCRIDQDPRG